MTAVLPRGARAKHEHEKGALEEARRPSPLDRIEKAAKRATTIDKGIDATQEMTVESADWATEVYTQIASGNLFGMGS